MKLIILIGVILIGVLSLQEHHVHADCVPGESFSRDCNTCFCTDNGEEACTEKACLSTSDVHIQHDEPEVEVAINQVCKPNEIKMEDCNRCRCANNGIGWFCTKNSCPPNKDLDSPTFRCNPGETFKNDCKTCTCLADGKTATCTPESCPIPKSENLVVETQERQLTYEESISTDFTCTPGEAFRVDCNRCVCSPNGKNAACTQKGCISHSIKVRDVKQCEPGTTWNDDCNTCRCTSNGNAACTRKLCLPADFGPKHVKRETVREITSAEVKSPDFRCTPGESMKLDCNTCSCAPNGKLAFCTLKGCPSDFGHVQAKRETVREITSAEVKSPDFRCTPGESMKLDCNTCSCAPNGKLAFCTLKGCPSDFGHVQAKRETVREITSAEVKSPDFRCTPGESMKLDCNTCNCAPNGKLALCTLMGCPSHSIKVREAQQCEPGTTWKDDCNTCRCSANGLAACTKKFCIPDDSVHKHAKRETLPVYTLADIRAPNFQCTPGDRFMLDCNACTCTPDGKNGMCTLKGCPSDFAHTPAKREAVRQVTNAEIRSKDFTCTPGENFRLDCNTCTCTPDGKNGLCTLKGCPSDFAHTLAKRKVVRQLTHAEVNSKDFKCSLGDQFQLDCNACFCNLDETSVMCTYRLCPSDFAHTPAKRETNVEQLAKQCEPGTTWKDDCNTCRCSPTGLAACTRKGCPSSVMKRETKPECEPGTTWKDDCNTCRCSANGLAACTKKFCVPEPSRSRRDTPVATTPVINGPGYKCVPNSSFKFECNDCNCDEHGLLASCTYKLCHPGDY